MDNKTLDMRAEEMAEFILPMIDSSNKTHDVIMMNDKKIHYLNTTVGVLLLLNRPYTEKEYSKMLDVARDEKIMEKSFNVIFYKDQDEEMYFRRKLFKPKTATSIQENGRNEQSEMYRLVVDDKKEEYHKKSLRFYTPEQKERIMDPTKPEEERVKSARRITYYQPKFQELEKKLLTYTFWDVVYNYQANKPSAETDKRRGFFKEEEVAKDCNIWVECKEHNGILIPSFNVIKSTQEYICENKRSQTPRHAYITSRNNI